VCTSNAAKVLDAIARLLGVTHGELDQLALAATPGGPVLLPYFDGERTPNRPDATGIIAGLRSDVSREQFARAVIDGVACALLDGLDALTAAGATPRQIVLTGGGARSAALRAVLAGAADLPVAVSDTAEAVATGAAVQAAAVLADTDFSAIQQRWGLGTHRRIEPLAPTVDLRQRYGDLRDNAPG
jgi:xylulokinase